MKFFSKKNSTDKKKSKKSNVIMLPNDAHYHRQRGMAMMNNNQNEEALLCFKKALEIDPNDIETLTAIAMLLTEIERAEEALVMCNFVLDRLDDDPDQIYVLMATNYVSILQFDAAYRALELVRTTGKNKYVCADAKRMQREIEQYCEDSERDKHFFDFDRALLFFKVNDFDRAEQLLHALNEKYPDHVDILNQLVYVYISTDRIHLAQKMIHHMDQIDPENVLAMCSQWVINVRELLKRNKKIDDETLQRMRDDLLGRKPENEQEYQSLASVFAIAQDDHYVLQMINPILKNEESRFLGQAYHIAAIASFNLGMYDHARLYWRKLREGTDSDDWVSMYEQLASYWIEHGEKMHPMQRITLKYESETLSEELVEWLQRVQVVLTHKQACVLVHEQPLFWMMLDLEQFWAPHSLPLLMEYYMLYHNERVLQKFDAFMCNVEQPIAARRYAFFLKYVVLLRKPQSAYEQMARAVEWPLTDQWLWEELLLSLYETMKSQTTWNCALFVNMLSFVCGRAPFIYEDGPTRRNMRAWKAVVHYHAGFHGLWKMQSSVFADHKFSFNESYEQSLISYYKTTRKSFEHIDAIVAAPQHTSSRMSFMRSDPLHEQNDWDLFEQMISRLNDDD